MTLIPSRYRGKHQTIRNAGRRIVTPRLPARDPTVERRVTVVAWGASGCQTFAHKLVNGSKLCPDGTPRTGAPSRVVTVGTETRTVDLKSC
jgi:hypothetical protein